MGRDYTFRVGREGRSEREKKSNKDREKGKRSHYRERERERERERRKGRYLKGSSQNNLKQKQNVWERKREEKWKWGCCWLSQSSQICTL